MPFCAYISSTLLPQKAGTMRKTPEGAFQSNLIKELEQIFPGCFILKNDTSYLQGVPDLLILFNNRWAMLECKKSAKADHEPNQDYYVDLLNDMSFSAFIFPENKEEVLHDLQRSFESSRKPRVSKR